MVYRNLSDIKFPLTRFGRAIRDADDKAILFIEKESTCTPVVTDQIAARILELLNEHGLQLASTLTKKEG